MKNIKSNVKGEPPAVNTGSLVKQSTKSSKKRRAKGVQPVGSTALLDQITVSSEKQSITLPIGEKIPVIASDWKDAERLYNSMSQDHREVCRIMIGQSRKEYLPSRYHNL